MPMNNHDEHFDHRPVDVCIFMSYLLVVLGAFTLYAEKIMVYDEEKGIIFVEKDEVQAYKSKSSREKSGAPPAIPKPPEPANRKPSRRAPPAAPSKSSRKEDIHVNRSKDPPQLYFTSGLEYFKNQDFENALKNFMYADSVRPQPAYSLWVGKTLRRMGKYEQMMVTMNKIHNSYPESDVADDALFEIAFYHQTTGNYQKALDLYKKLAEQFPFGRSFSNNEEFREIAKEQRKSMRAEMITALNILGYSGDDLAAQYKAFQRDNNLPITGAGNQETIRAIKAAHSDFLQREADRAARQQQMKKHSLWGMIISGVLVINLLMILFQRTVIAGKNKQLASLSQLLHDLDSQAL
ncbi:MAG: tetratricopeptide repeat protein [Chitinivibrionales bacterium]|nr:tetratricopeptide repeat protein [Chitinivibrionales bacterium]